MAKKNTRPVRIDELMEEEIKKFSRDNELSGVVSSRELAKMLRRFKGKKFIPKF